MIMSKKRKIIVLALVGIVCVVGLYFAWRVMFETPIEDLPPISNTNTFQGDGGVNEEKNKESAAENAGDEIPSEALGDPLPTLEKLSDQEVRYFWINKKTSGVFYVNFDGDVYVAKEGDDEKISPQAVGTIYTLLPNQNGEKIIASFGEKNNPQFGVFDVIDKTWKPLPQEILSVVWGTSEKKLFGIIKNNGKHDFVEINTEKTPPIYKTFLKDFVLKDVSLSIIPNDRILIYEKSSDFYSPKIWEFNPKDLSLSLITQGERGGVFGLSKDLKNLFLSVPSKNGLVVVANSLKTIVSVDFFTIPDKCDSFASTTYCFVPETQNNPANFFNSYDQRKIFTSDTIMSFNISSKEIGVLNASRALPYKTDASHVVFFDNYLYFKNRYDDFLYKLDISKN
jgi:hypothetical protein